ncbi:MAG: hypothetical protein ACRDIV_11695 [Ktedonobacteraceae bacterium]
MKMKRLAVGLTLLVVTLLSLLWIVPSMAANTHGHQAGAAHPKSVFALEHQVGKPGATMAAATLTLSCGPNAVKGNLLINVTEKVINDADSGQAGNYWGLDAFTRTIKVWNLGSDSYCAVVSYTGTFAAQAGQKSPGTTTTTGGILTGDEIGTMKGGYVGQITGPLDVTDPGNWPLVGKVNLGSPVDYQCVIATDGSANCPGTVDWTTKYFDTASTSFTFNENPWGWTYVGKDGPGSDAGTPDGVWRNFITGNSGDILDVD